MSELPRQGAAMQGIAAVATALAKALVDTNRYQLRELGASMVTAGEQYRVVVWDRSSDGHVHVQAHSEEEETAGEVVYSGPLGGLA